MRRGGRAGRKVAKGTDPIESGDNLSGRNESFLYHRFEQRFE